MAGTALQAVASPPAPAAAPGQAADPVLLRMPFSHYCRKAEWGLTVAGVPYRTVDVRLLRMRDLHRASPEGTVPVLRDGDRVLYGSSAVLQWAQRHKAPHAPDLYPPPVRAQVEAWESWADQGLGAVVRREAYRALHRRPGLAAAHGLPLWMRLPPARRFYLTVLKLLRARRFEVEDERAVRDAVARIAAQLERTRTGYLFAPHPTAADVATAALVEPLLPAAEEFRYSELPGWLTVTQFVARVRPFATTRTGGRRIREADWRDFERLKRAAPAALPGLRCECGVPDWSRA